MGERELLRVGEKAVAEYAAWKNRNAARGAEKKWRRDVGYERGQSASESDFEADEWAEYKVIQTTAIAAAAQTQYSPCRYSPRRCCPC